MSTTKFIIVGWNLEPSLEVAEIERIMPGGEIRWVGGSRAGRPDSLKDLGSVPRNIVGSDVYPYSEDLLAVLREKRQEVDDLKREAARAARAIRMSVAESRFDAEALQQAVSGEAVARPEA